MKKNFKKTISAVLCLCMILCVPVFASAAEATVELGSYPQSRVTDAATISSLNGLNAEFVSYGYYSGDGNAISSAESGNYMKYADVELNSTKYRGVVFTSYRPNFTYMTADTEHSYQDDNGYEPNTVYWFKYEPVKWKVLDAKSGYCVTEKIIDSQAFCDGFRYDGSMTYYSDSTESHPANEYAYSKINSWLENGFSSEAFSSEELSEINADNGKKVYLMSKAKADSFFGTEEAKKAEGTDYAKCQGLFVSNGTSSWMLSDSDTDVYSGLKSKIIKQSGADGQENIFSTCLGVRPCTMIDSVIPEYTVTWYTENDSFTKNTLREDDTIVKPNDPEKEGYTFKGWDKTVPASMATESLEFHAVWEKNTYKVTWNMYGRQSKVDVAYGDPITAPTPAEKPDYIFKGWDSAIPSEMPAHDLVFNAQYEEAYIVFINIKNTPKKTRYNYKESDFNLEGLEVEATMINGKRKTITDTSALTINGFDTKSVGQKTVTVEYQGCKAQFTITVSYTWWQNIIRIFLLGFLWY